MRIHEEQIQWCIDQHRNTNHYYDKYLPYEFHLRMVVQVANDFIELLPDKASTNFRSFKDNVILACWGHDLIEDTRTSYNDVKKVFGQVPADIIYALTNEKGRNRKERGNDVYYKGIRETEGAVFAKLCDRIANVQYSKITKSRMFEMYKKENDDFLVKMGWDDSNTHPYFKMFAYLTNLFLED